LFIMKEKMKNYLRKNIDTIIGIGVGALAGFFYWQQIGCSSGTCMITSKPLNSTVYGGIMGGLLFSIFQPKKKENKI